jgi:hypothetical protein
MLFAVLLVLPACNRSDDDRVRAARESNTTNNTDAMKQQRDDYVSTVEAKLAEFDKKTDGLDERARSMTGAAKNDFKNAIDGLHDQRKEVGKKLSDLKGVSVESWMTMKGEVDSAVEGLERSYEQVSAQFEKLPAAKPSTKRTY